MIGEYESGMSPYQKKKEGKKKKKERKKEKEIWYECMTLCRSHFGPPLLRGCFPWFSKVERFLTSVLLSTFVFDFCLSLGDKMGP